jgi:hypothetical protein
MPTRFRCSAAVRGNTTVEHHWMIRCPDLQAHLTVTIEATDDVASDNARSWVPLTDPVDLVKANSGWSWSKTACQATGPGRRSRDPRPLGGFPPKFGVPDSATRPASSTITPVASKGFICARARTGSTGPEKSADHMGQALSQSALASTGGVSEGILFGVSTCVIAGTVQASGSLQSLVAARALTKRTR